MKVYLSTGTSTRVRKFLIGGFIVYSTYKCIFDFKLDRFSIKDLGTNFNVGDLRNLELYRVLLCVSSNYVV